jgi:peptidyl-prolyl cis-trans isomerase SurA
MKLRRLFLTATALSAFAVATNAPTSAAEPAALEGPQATIVAIVENRIITWDDVLKEVSPLLDNVRREARNEKEFNDRRDDLISVVLNRQINRLLVVHDFKKDPRRRIPDSAIDTYIVETIAKEFGGDRTKFLQYLARNGWNPRDFRQVAEERIIYDFMSRQHRKSETVVSPLQVEEYYRAHQDSADFRQADAVRLRLISLNRQPGEADAALLARVQPVIARLNAGEKFEAVAREAGDMDPAQRAKGGDLGWTNKADLSPEFALPAFTLEKGAFSGPIVRTEACYLIYVEDRKAAGLKPLSEVNGIIQQELADRLGLEAEARWIARLRENSYVRVSLHLGAAP